MKEKLNHLLIRIRENFKQNKIAVIAMLLIWAAVVVFTLVSYSDSLGKISTGNEFYENIVELSQGMEVSETVPVVEGSDVVAVKLATYARKNNGDFEIKVTGTDSDTLYAEKKIRVSSLQDNAFLTIRLSEKLSPEKDKKIQIVLFSDCEKDQGAGVYYSEAKAFENSVLTVGGIVQEGDLSLRFLSESKELNLFYHIVITWVVVTFTLIILMLLLIKPKYEILFMIIAICFGLTFWLIITPMSVPDETVHYEYSFQLSNYLMGKEDHLIFDEEYQNYGAMAGHMNISAAYERFIKKINDPMSLDNHDIRMEHDIDESYKICFVPQAVGITVARLLNWNMLRTFYLGRLFNLAFYVFCVYIAIKKTPVHKVLFGFISTLPIFMQQAASFSYDCYINGLTMIIIAILLKWMNQEEMIDKKEFIFAFIVNLMISPIKVVYGLFSFLYWFIPAERYGSKKNKIIGTLIITAPAMYQLTILLFPLIFRIVRKAFEKLILQRIHAETIGNVPIRLEGDVYSFSYVTDHPLEALALFARTIRYGIKTWFYASFGRALSGSTLILPTYLVHATLGLVILSSLREEEYKDSLLFKAAIIALCVFAGLMMVGGMLVSWTEINQEVIEDYGGPIIQGIQGRYFSPLLPYLFLIFHNNRIKIPKKFDQYMIFAFVVLVFEVVVYVLSYTFMN